MPLAAKNDGTRLRFSRQVRKLRSLPTTSTPTIPYGSLAAVWLFPLRKHSGLSARQRNSRTRAPKGASAWMGSAFQIFCHDYLPKEHLAARCRQRGYTMDEVRACIVSEDGDQITFN
jgi:hypothetical protein